MGAVGASLNERYFQFYRDNFMIFPYFLVVVLCLFLCTCLYLGS